MNQFFKEQIIHPSDSMPEILNKFGSSNGNEIFINYSIFKLIASPSTYSIIVAHIIQLLETTVRVHPKIIVHVYFKKLTVGDLDKHKPFIFDIIKKLGDEYPNVLDACYLYKTPFVFLQIYNVILIAIDKETREKIHIIKEP